MYGNSSGRKLPRLNHDLKKCHYKWKSGAYQWNYFHTTLNRIINKGKQTNIRQSTCSSPRKTCLEKKINSTSGQSDKEVVKINLQLLQHTNILQQCSSKASRTFNKRKEVINQWLDAHNICIVIDATIVELYKLIFSPQMSQFVF
jgi:hypothetical protein